MSEIRFRRVGEIGDPNLLALIDELEWAAGVPSAEFLSLPLGFFLTQCVYPTGEPETRIPISSAGLPLAPLLDSKVGRLPDGELRTLCAELASTSGRALEFFHDSTLAAFLNGTIPKLEPAGKRTADEMRRDRVVMRRRANRG
jgi:hypothetical protein